MNTSQNKSRRKSILFLVIAIAFSIALLLGIAYVVLTNSAREQAYRTAAVLADQVESILNNNEQKEASLIASLKENYIAKAKAVAYIIDRNPEIETSIAEQIRIAKEVVQSRRHSKDVHSLVKGLMIESYIEDGAQKISCDEVYGKSITDPCLGWEKTERLIYDLAEML